MAATADDIARDLREQIRTGRLSAGDRLPTVDAMTAHYGVATQTVRAALEALKAEGLVAHQGGRGGNVVRSQPERHMITRNREMQRDQRGYYSSGDIKGWQREFTTSEERPVPADIAEHLGVDVGAITLLRSRMVAHPEQRELRHHVQSWIHPEVYAAMPTLAGDTGPGGSLDRIEEHYGKPLTWSEIVTAHAASPEERELLMLPAGVPVLRVLRVATIGRSSKVAMLDDFSMSAELFGMRYPVGRATSARWPVTPAVDRYGNQQGS